jgi:hypothetical protein
MLDGRFSNTSRNTSPCPNFFAKCFWENAIDCLRCFYDFVPIDERKHCEVFSIDRRNLDSTFDRLMIGLSDRNPQIKLRRRNPHLSRNLPKQFILHSNPLAKPRCKFSRQIPDHQRSKLLSIGNIALYLGLRLRDRRQHRYKHRYKGHREEKPQHNKTHHWKTHHK